MSFHPVVPYGADQHKSERELPTVGESFTFTPERRARLEEIASRYPAEHRRSAILPALYLAQEQIGYITGNAMREVAALIGCTPAEVEDVVSYYTMFSTKPTGRYVIQVCRTLSCALNGAERVTEALQATLGVGPGENDATGDFTLIEVECLGACDRAPVVMINDHWQEAVDPDDVGRMIDELRSAGPSSLTGCHLNVEKR
jgi:NADH-quinone oxidoreductase E subunit